MTRKATIAIVGKPNVGKSTLFNRLIGKRHAIIANEAGTTRDRVSQHFDASGHDTLLVDTGGMEYGKQENIEEDVQAQARIAIEEADLILLVVDIANDLTVDDFSAANLLQKSKKPVILVANKSDSQLAEENIFNTYELGFGKPVKISAIHKKGIGELNTEISDKLKKLGFEKEDSVKKKDDITSICILGKPNAGKSSLVNALLGIEKVIVSNIPGTTRDMTDTEIEVKGKKYNLIDTAGLRRPGKRERGIEKFSALRCATAIDKSDIVVLLIDGDKGITAQDLHITQMALEAEKGLIIGINKSDLLETEDKEWLIRKVQRKFSFTPWAPLIFLSAKNKKNIFELFKLSDKIMEEREKRIETAELNSFFRKITQKHLPASAKMKKPKFMYGSQVASSPPKFVLFFKNSPNLHFSYPRYLENELRKEYGFNGTSIHLKFKNSTSVPKSER